MKLGNITFGPAFKDFDKFFVGFEDQYDRMSKLHDDLTKNIPNYPPYNIRKIDENRYQIEIAVAGFAKSEIDIELDGDKLVIRGVTKQEESNDYIFKGIANRAFTRAFALDDQMVVQDAELFNGMLKIMLERIIPEHKKPIKVEVRSADTKQLLNEEA